MIFGTCPERHTRPRPPRRASPLAAALAAASLALASPAAAAPTDADAASDAAAPAPDAAAPALKLAIITPLLKGAEDPLLVSQLEQDLRGGMQRGRLVLLEAADVARVAGGSCEDAACIERLGRELGATFVLRALVTVADRDYNLRIELVDTRNRETAAESERVCELCGLAELRALTADQAARLLARLDALAKPPPVLALSAQPAGASVLIDGNFIGLAPVERTLLEGEHVVRVMSEGYVAEERKLVAVAGVRETVQIRLKRTPESIKLRKTGWALLSLGIPVFGAGVALLARDGAYVRSSCDDRDLADAQRCASVYNTDVGGAVLLAAGTLLGTIGTMLLLRTRERTRAPKKLRAQLGPTYFGLSGSF